MDENVIDEFLESILSALASAETQSAALASSPERDKERKRRAAHKSDGPGIERHRNQDARYATAAETHTDRCHQRTREATDKKEDRVEPEKKKPEQDDSGKAAEQDFTKQESHQQEAKKPKEAPTQREQEATPQEASSSESAPKQESAEEKPEEHETREAGPKKRPPESQPKTEKPPDQASG